MAGNKPGEPQLEGLRRQVRRLEGRDVQLWSIQILIALLVAAGFVALALPNLLLRAKDFQFDTRYLPTLVFGFIVLIVLFNVHALSQQKRLQSARCELFEQLVRSHAAEKSSLIDPLTEAFNRRYLERILPKEVSRADRMGTTLTFMMIDLDDFKSVNTRFGHLVGDRLLSQTGQLLNSVFRRSDTVIRYGGDEFLVVMPETDGEQARHAVERLYRQVETWNRDNVAAGYQLSLSCGLASYTRGANVEEVLKLADQKMYAHKSTHSPAS